MEKEKGIIKNKPHIMKAAVEIPNLNITYQKKRKAKKKTTKKYKRYYDNDDGFNDDIDGASESNEESNNFDDDDNDNVNYEKKCNKTYKKQKKKGISNNLNK